MNLKKLTKLLRKNESTVSMALGVLVILIVGFFIIKNFNKTNDGEIIPSIGTEEESQIGQKYVVQKGDDLWKISEKLLGTGYDWNKIADLNNITAPYNLEAGQELQIPIETAVAEATKQPEPTISTEPTVVATVAPSPTGIETIKPQGVSQSITGNTYEVVKGDNLWDIAVRAYGDGYKWVEIAKSNGLKNPNIIHSGNVFVIPR